MKKIVFVWGFFLLAFLFFCTNIWAMPEKISYQGKLNNSDNTSVEDGNYIFMFSLYNVPSAGTALWSEPQLVVVAGGIYNVTLPGDPGSYPFPATLLDEPGLYLGVRVEPDLEMEPRQEITSTFYALKAGDTETLQGYGSQDFALVEHQHSGEDITTGTIAESRIDSAIARDLEISWANLLGIPAGFSDGVDNDSGGTITSINAGTGLNGGGSTGDVALNVDVPLALTGSTTGTAAIVKGTNNGSGYGLYGWSANNYGVLGYSVSAPGVSGYSGSGVGVEGLNGSWGNQGQLGTQYVGVYGKGMTSSSSGVYGTHNASGNVGKLGTGSDGVYGVSNATGGSGVAGINNSSGNGVYGRSVSGYAGNFAGKILASVADGPQIIVHDSDGGPTRPGIKFTNNSEQYIIGDDQSDEYFKFYSTFGKSRQYSAHLRVYGKAADAWDRSIGLTHDGDDGILETDYGDLILDPADGEVLLEELIPTLTLNTTESDPTSAYTRLNFSQNDAIKWQMEWDSKNQRLSWSKPSLGDCLVIHDATGNVETGSSLYVNGDLHVTGEITTNTETVRHTISPLEFKPMDSSWSYSVWGDFMKPKLAFLAPLPVYPFFAPVKLPDGVTVTKVIVNWTDDDENHGMCMTLDRATHNEGTGNRLGAALLGRR